MEEFIVQKEAVYAYILRENPSTQFEIASGHKKRLLK